MEQDLRKQIEELRNELKACKENEKLYMDLINDQGEGIGIVDENENFVFVNPAACRIFGLTKSQLIGTSLKEFVDEETFHIFLNETRKRKKGKSSSYEFVIHLKSGNEKTILVTASPFFDAERGFKGTMSIFRDISDRKKAEMDLALSEEKYKRLFEKSSDPILIIEGNMFVDCNDAAVTFLKGKSKKDIVPCHPWDVSPPKQNGGRESKEKAIEMIQLAMNNGYHRFEWMHRDKHGNDSWVDVALTNISEDETLKLFTVWRDISERKKAEQELIIAKEKAAESDRLKSAFLANMSHEIRTPMNSIMGFSDLLRDAESNEMERFISLIETNSEQLLQLINDILDVSKIEANQIHIDKTNFELNSFLHDIMDSFSFLASKKNLKLEIDHDWKEHADLFLYTDQFRLRQIINNLISNAIKFTNEGKIVLATLIEENELMVAIIDSGIGIAQKDQEMIFERFFRSNNEAKFAGTGLGLAIVKSLTELLGGTVALTSERNVGSTFTIKIPIK